MKIDLNDKEIRIIGERRDIRKRWKPYAVGIGISLAVTFACLPFESHLNGNPLRYFVAIPMISFLYFYISMFYTSDKAGKKFLAQCKKENAG